MTGRMPRASSTKKSKALFSRGSESGKERKHTNKEQPTVIITTKRDPAQKRQRDEEGMRKVRETGTFLPGGTSMCKGAGAQVCSTGDSNQRGLTGARVTIRQTLPFYRGEN